MLGSHDRQETAEEEQQAIRVLAEARSSLSALAPDLPEPSVGSVLRLERVNTAREPIDAMVLGQRARAVDNMARLFSLMFDAREKEHVKVYPYSGYSLVRAAIESAAVGLWLIDPVTKPARVLRALQRSYLHEVEALKFIELVADRAAVEGARRRHDRIVNRLVELKNTVGPLRQRSLGSPPAYTDILKSISEKDPLDRRRYAVTSPLVAWRISSAFIHGSETVIRSLSDIRQVGQFEEGIATFEITPSLRLIASVSASCVSLIGRLDARYMQCATHDHSWRPV
ncbi:hypothetical protein D8Y23_12810 [Microbacterium enclense]|uniref:Uncharacterized protein n=1 Tax=Microbacterium enclense TaxID=993073 RepID=A0A443J8H9_9MICO|nr:hypothetical protein [Microbacterium enclense]RWR16796.1 hypothetical protein D8Y23_12810 [Microbacterium enclense]